MAGRQLLKWTGVVSILMIVSRLLGFFREMAIAYRFGASAETDAYLIASTIPAILFMAFNDAVKTAFIPVYGEYHKKEEGNAFALTVFVLFGAVALLFSFLLVLGAPLLVRLVAPGFRGETFGLTVTMARILLPGLFFLTMTGLGSGLLHTKKDFVIPAIVGYPHNLLIIFSALVLGRRFGVMGLAWGTLAAFASQLLVQVPALAGHGVFGREKLLWRHPGLKKMAALLPPVLLGGAALELKSIVDRVFGSLLPEGSIAALNFASRLYLLPNGILVLALLTVIYPTLVELHVEGNVKEFKETLRQGIGLVTFVVFPMMVGMIALRLPIVRLAFERGAFDAAATKSTAVALAFYSLGLVALGAQLLMYRAFYALKDTVTPMYVTLVMMALNIFFNWVLLGPLGHGGIALGTALSINMGVLVLTVLLRKKIGAFGGSRLFATFWKSGIAAAVMGIMLVLLRNFLTVGGFARQAVELVVLVGVGALVYFVVSYLLQVEELAVGLNVIKKVFWRR